MQKHTMTVVFTRKTSSETVIQVYHADSIDRLKEIKSKLESDLGGKFHMYFSIA